MRIQHYTDQAKLSALKYVSCDALLLFVCDALSRRQPFSTVRMGDGERAIIEYHNTGLKSRYLSDPVWLKEYGVWGADLKRIGSELLQAAKIADCLCPNISGLTLPKYELLSVLPERERIGEGLYAHTWLYMGRVPELMAYDGDIGVVCREPSGVAQGLSVKYNRPIEGFETARYSSWLDYDQAMKEIGEMKAHFILVAAGPSGKFLCAEASKKFGKVVLDVGSALVRHWSMMKTRAI